MALAPIKSWRAIHKLDKANSVAFCAAFFLRKRRRQLPVDRLTVGIAAGVVALSLAVGLVMIATSRTDTPQWAATLWVKSPKLTEFNSLLLAGESGKDASVALTKGSVVRTEPLGAGTVSVTVHVDGEATIGDDAQPISRDLTLEVEHVSQPFPLFSRWQVQGAVPTTQQ